MSGCRCYHICFHNALLHLVVYGPIVSALKSCMMSFCATPYRLPWWSICIVLTVLWRTQYPHMQQLKSSHTHTHDATPWAGPIKTHCTPVLVPCFVPTSDISWRERVWWWRGHFSHPRFISPTHGAHCWKTFLPLPSPQQNHADKDFSFFIFFFSRGYQILSFICILHANSCIDYQKLCYYCDWISWNRSFDKF